MLEGLLMVILQQDNSNADSSTRNVRFLVSPSQHAALMVQYAKYNHMDNPVVQKLIEEYGLSREQIQVQIH